MSKIPASPSLYKIERINLLKICVLIFVHISLKNKNCVGTDCGFGWRKGLHKVFMIDFEICICLLQSLVVLRFTARLFKSQDLTHSSLAKFTSTLHS